MPMAKGAVRGIARGIAKDNNSTLDKGVAKDMDRSWKYFAL